jgi:hypothetical protein
MSSYDNKECFSVLYGAKFSALGRSHSRLRREKGLRLKKGPEAAFLLGC